MNSKDYFPSGLHSSSWKTRAQTIEDLSLSTDDPEYLFPILFASLYDKEPTVRMLAGHFLQKKIPKEIVIEHLRQLLNAKERQIRFSAVIALENILEEFLLPFLNEIDEKDPEIKERLEIIKEYLES